MEQVQKPSSPTQGHDEKIDVLYMSTYGNNRGGMSIAATRIHRGLRSIGINSKMLVMGGVGGNGIYAARPLPGEIYGRTHDDVPLKDYPNIPPFYKISPAIAGIDVSRQIKMLNPRIVQMHWICDGFVKVEDLAKINKKIVWRLSDCWAFTGGCFYTTECEKYKTSCYNCVRLQSGVNQDLSYSVWKRKEETYAKLDLTVVVPTMWMKEMAKDSALLRDREIVIIPNGIERDVYYPEDKVTARRALGIPLDKKIIVFGAGSLTNPRKGADLLRDALNKFSPEEKNNLHLIAFGGFEMPAGFGIPMTFKPFSIDSDRLRYIYSAGDVMIVPSREEAFGQTVTEAMACGLPVVTFLHTGPASAVEHMKSGYLANFANSGDLADGIKWVLADEERLLSLSEAAKRRIETTFDIKIVAGQYQRLYEQLLKEPFGRK